MSLKIPTPTFFHSFLAKLAFLEEWKNTKMHCEIAGVIEPLASYIFSVFSLQDLCFLEAWRKNTKMHCEIARANKP